MAGLKKTFFSSLILIILSLSKKTVGLVSTLILARLLTPEDFGIVAIATLAFGLLEVLSNSGSGQYIMTSSDSSRKVLNTAFTCNVILKTTIAIVFAATSTYIAEFYNDQRLVPVFIVFSLILLVTGFSNPMVILLKKRQEYKSIARMITIAKVISVLFAIATALITESYWALVMGQFLAYTLPVVGGYIIAPFKPKFDLSNLKDQLSFSGWIVPSSLLGYFRAQIDTIIISRTFDSTVLGSYHVMKYLALIPNMHFIGPMTEPLLAQLSSIKDNRIYFFKMFNVSFFVAMAFSVPISHLFFTHAELIVNTVLGSQWGSYSKFIGLFGLMITFTAMYHQAKICLLAFKLTKAIFMFELITTAVIGITLYLLTTNNPYDFALTKISIEIWLSIFMFFYIFIKYSGLIALIKISTIMFILLCASFLADSLSNTLFGTPKSIVDMLPWLSIYTSLYISTLLGALFVLKSHLEEFQYLWIKIVGLKNLLRNKN